MSLFTRRSACTVGIHGPFRYRWGRTPHESFRWCSSCWAKWRGTYDGIEAGWQRVPDTEGTCRCVPSPGVPSEDTSA